MKTTLFVAGFNSRTRARSLAYEFERYGRLVRCDIPTPKSYSSKPYAFVEFENSQDAEDAFSEMHGRTIEGHVLSVQWARIPSGGFSADNRRSHYNKFNNTNQQTNKSRSRSPYRRERSSSPPRGRSPPRYNNTSPTPSTDFQRDRSYSRSPDH